MSERNFDVLWAFSTKKQSAYGTKLADGDLTLAHVFKGPDAVVRSPVVQDDSEQAGRGTEFPTEQEIERWDVSLARSFDLTSLIAGWAAAFGLGSITTTQPDAGGSPNTYDHQCRFMTNSKSLPVTSVVEQPTSATDLKSLYRDLAVADFEISGDSPGRLQLAMNLLGSGWREASTLSMPSLTAGAFLHMHGLKLEVGPTGSLVDLSSRLKSFRLGVNNNPLEDDGYYPGSGLYRGRLEYGERRTMELVLKILVGDSTERDHLEANDYLKCVITAEGALIEDVYKHTMTITCPRIAYEAVQQGFEEGLAVYELTCKVFHDATAGYPLDITVRNNVVSYLTT